MLRTATPPASTGPTPLAPDLTEALKRLKLATVRLAVAEHGGDRLKAHAAVETGGEHCSNPANACRS
jgi:hypothetical protein